MQLVNPIMHIQKHILKLFCIYYPQKGKVFLKIVCECNGYLLTI